MQAEIITIGDEILIGQTIDTNAAFIAKELNAIGVTVKQKRTIADRADAIKEALDLVLPDTKLVFMTGGLGPTNDDITKKTLNEYFGGELRFHEDVYENILRLFSSFNRTPKEVHRLQAYLPSSAEIIPNRMGTASGMHFQKNGVHYFSTPGVPYETEHIFTDQIIPWIDQNINKGTVVHQTILTQGMGESDIAEILEDFENNLPEDVSLAYLPSPGLVRLRLTTYKGEAGEAVNQISTLAEEMKTLLQEIVVGQDVGSLEALIGVILREKDMSVSTAESCTGGMISSLITRIPGSSDYFHGGIVSYSNEAKSDLLGVDEDDIKEYGAVSETVAMQMADGARKKFSTDYAISTTGVAGPGGGSAEKPVGTVWIGISGPERTKAWNFSFGKNRERNIRMTAVTALNLLRREIKKFETTN